MVTGEFASHKST